MSLATVVVVRPKADLMPAAIASEVTGKTWGERPRPAHVLQLLWPGERPAGHMIGARLWKGHLHNKLALSLALVRRNYIRRSMTTSRDGRI